MAGIGAFISPGKTLERGIERVAARRRARLRLRLHDPHRRPRLADGADGLRGRQRDGCAGHRRAADLLPDAGLDRADRGDDRRVLGRAHGARARRLAQGHGRELVRLGDHQARHPDARVRPDRARDPPRRAAPEGEFFNSDFQFMGYEARADLPIYIAALSPNMLRLAGEIADGVMLWLCRARLHPRRRRARGAARAARRPARDGRLRHRRRRARRARRRPRRAPARLRAASCSPTSPSPSTGG